VSKQRPADQPAGRPSRMRYFFLFVLGLFAGRVASDNFGPGALDAVDLLMFIGIAVSLVWWWRSWARDAFEQRRRQALERQQRRDRAAEKRADHED